MKIMFFITKENVIDFSFVYPALQGTPLNQNYYFLLTLHIINHSLYIYV